MPKAYSAPAPFNDDKERIDVAMTSVQSNQVKEIGYDAATKTLAVTFTRGAGAIYQYPDVDPQLHADFLVAESIGRFFGERIQPPPFKKFKAPEAAA